MEPDAPVPAPSEHGRPDGGRSAPGRPAGTGGPRGRSGGGPPREEATGLGPLLELEGVVVEGVEAGAVVLRADAGGTWFVGAAHRHLLGHRVRVRGAERRGVLTTAQQGPPLAVEAVEDLGPA